MKRLLAISGPAFAVIVVFLVAGVAVLSAATRRPYPEAGRGSWHISKAGHMTEAESHESDVTRPADLAEEVEAAISPLPIACVSPRELLPNAFSLIVHKHHFRSPPFLQ